jgi:hypothetical protein
MYLTYENFKIIFESDKEITSTNYTILEEFAEDLIYNYVHKVISNPHKDVGFATGLIIQHMIAIGILPKNLSPISAGGINSNPSRDFMSYIPDEAKKILDNYRSISI